MGMGKYWGAFVSAGGMACLTAIPGFVPPDHLVWLRWRLAMAAAFVLGLTGIAVQLYLQRREERRRDTEERKWREEQSKQLTTLVESVIVEVEKRKTKQSGSEIESVPLQAPNTAAQASPIHEEIYRVLVSPKSPFAEMTRDVMKMMKRGDDFRIDVDFLVEMYLVNVSDRNIYLRDFYGLIEVDGKEVRLPRQKDFFAWEVNDKNWEWCLDLSDGKNLFDRELEPLTDLSNNLQKQWEPNRPIEGWIRLLAPQIDPEKLSENKTLKLFAVDSVGKEYLLQRGSSQQRRGKLGTRPQ